MASRSEVGAIAGMDSEFGSIPERGRRIQFLVRLFLFKSSFHDIAITCTHFSYTFLTIFHSLVGHANIGQRIAHKNMGHWRSIGIPQVSTTWRLHESLAPSKNLIWQEDCSREYRTLMKYWNPASNHLMATWKSSTRQEQNMALASEILHPIARTQEIYYSLSEAKQISNRMVGPTVLTWISLFAKPILGTSKQTTNFGKAIPYGTPRTFLINQWERSE